MTAVHAELCRITVHGPRGRVDLAVPQSLSVASLMPVLLHRIGVGPRQQNATTADGGQGTWVLQRLGEQPLDPTGTPETLDWRDGEEFHLRPVADPLPELDFDDVADGMATAVLRQPGRWQPEFNRWLFLGCALGAIAMFAIGVTSMGPAALVISWLLVAGCGLLVGAITTAARRADPMVVLLLGLAGCALVAWGAAVAASRSGAVLPFTSGTTLFAGLALLLAGGVLVAARLLGVSAIPYTPFGAVAAVGALAALAQWFRLALALTPVQVAGSFGTALVIMLVFAARIGIRMSRIRGPQLPETAEDLQRHAEPIPAEEIISRAADADAVLTVLTVTAAVGTGCTYPYLLAYGGFGTVLAALFAVAALLRARASHTVWQRVPMVVAGGLGAALVVLTLLRDLSQQAGTVALILLIWVFVALMMAVTRPVTRRLLPIWGHLANGLETLSALALVPVLVQLFHVYSVASGLFR